jgi:hypothetical protein
MSTTFTEIQSINRLKMKRYAIVLIVVCMVFTDCKKDKEPSTEEKKIEYPKTENSLLNVLSDSLTQIIGGQKYCVAAKLPKGTSCKVTIKPSSGYTSSGIGIFQLENNGWTLINVDSDNTNLQATGAGQTVSISFMTGPPTSVDFFVYENDSIKPKKVKTLKNF